MYIGIDLGTSSVKVILMNSDSSIIGSQSVNLSLSRLKPLWSEQNPEDWWQATDQAMQALKSQFDMTKVKAIGLSGQMHGATLLDRNNNVLRPAILWNDGRSELECNELTQLVPNVEHITGNIMMAGFTAPKLKWIEKNEPDIFSNVHKVLLPKDYLRFRITNQFATDMSDAAGTMWLNIAKRDWDETLLAACKLTRKQMPTLYEGTEITGIVKNSLASRWGVGTIPVIAGGGDNAAGAIGVGLSQTGDAMLSLGTSGVYFVVTDQFLSKPQQAVHSFCHAIPNRWHLMSVMLSASSCLDWACQILNINSVSELLRLVETSKPPIEPVYFLPYLSGERTPHNNPYAKGAFFNLTMGHKQSDLARAVVEGVSFALADCMDVLHSTGINPDKVLLIGGGAKSRYWCQLLSDISGKTLVFCEGGNVGPALGAAKLAKIACEPSCSITDIIHQPKVIQEYHPNQTRYNDYRANRQFFNQLYLNVKPLFQ